MVPDTWYCYRILFSLHSAAQTVFLDQSRKIGRSPSKGLQAFESNLHTTKERTGILIMISVLEHRVEILADKGINDKVAKTPGTNTCPSCL